MSKLPPMRATILLVACMLNPVCFGASLPDIYGRVEVLLNSHDVILSEIDSSLSKISALCVNKRKSATSVSSIDAALLSEESELQLKATNELNILVKDFQEKAKGRVASICVLSNPSADKKKLCEQSKVRLKHIDKVAEWAARWSSLQTRRLELLKKMTQLESQECTREGFSESVLRAHSEFELSQPNQGVVLFKSLFETFTKLDVHTTEVEPDNRNSLLDLLKRLLRETQQP